MRNAAAACIFLTAIANASGTFPGGPQVVTIPSAADGSQQPAAIYVPPRLDRSKSYPLVVALHETGSNHRLQLRRLFGKGNLPGESNLEASRVFPPLGDYDIFALAPASRGFLRFEGMSERDFYGAIEWMKSNFPIDADRIYLTGIYTGATAALRLAESKPSLWAALAVVCPEPSAVVERDIVNLRIPVRIDHGERDILVPPSGSRRLQKLLVDQGTPVEYIEYPGGKHNAWDTAYRAGAIFDWLVKFRRTRFPNEVSFQTAHYRNANAWWLEITGLTPGEQARADVRLTGRNTADATTSGLDAFRLRLAGHPLYSTHAPLEIRIDGHLLRTRLTSFKKTEAGWKAAAFEPSPGSKRDSLEGPMADVLAGRHIYVYGTRGSERQVAEWRSQAEEAAQWSTRRQRVPVTLPVAADFELSEHDTATANLVLMGTRHTNSVIDKLAPRLPFALSPSAVDYGLAYIYAVDGRYVLVNSGLPWWTGAPWTEGEAQAPFRVLDRFGDFVLFKGSLDHVLADGRFDINWKLPREAAREMAASGAVLLP